MLRIEETNREHVSRLKANYITLEQANKSKLEKLGMSFEDIRSYSVMLFNDYSKNLAGMNAVKN